MAGIRQRIAKLLGVDVDSIQARDRLMQSRISELREKLEKSREMNKTKTAKIKEMAERVEFWKRKTAAKSSGGQATDVLNQRISVLKNQLTEVRASAKRYAAQRDALKVKLASQNTESAK